MLSLFLPLVGFGAVPEGAGDPLTTYRSEIVGDYARPGRCGEATERLSFRPTEVIRGGLHCRVGDVVEDAVSLTIDAHTCSAAGEVRPNHRFRIEFLSGSSIRVRDNDTTATLQRCGS